MFSVSSFISSVLVGVTAAVAARVLVFLSKQFYRLSRRTIKEARRRQDVQSVELLSSYADLEELLGDFLEKYRAYARQKSPLSRWGFFCKVVPDVVRLTKALFVMTIRRLLEVDETPRA